MRPLISATLALCLTTFCLGQGASTQEADAALVEFQRYFSNKNPHVRRAAVEDIGSVDHIRVTRVLLQALSDPDAAVQQAVSRALGKQRNELGLADLTKHVWRGRKLPLRIAILDGWRDDPPKNLWTMVEELLADRAWPIRERAAQMVPHYGDPEGRGTGALAPLLEAKEVEVRLAALNSLGQLKHSKSNRLAIPLLEDSDWRVRAGAIALLRELRDQVSIEPLIAVMEREQGRLIDDAHAALVDLTGRTLPADPERWRQWWKSVSLGYRLPTREELAAKAEKEKAARAGYDEPPKRGYPPYHGIRTRSRKLLFVLDISASMADRVTLNERDPKEVQAFEERYGSSRIKIDVAREELIGMVAGLEPPAHFNILLFDATVQSFDKGLLLATGATKNRAIKWLTRLTPDSVAAAEGAQGQLRGETNTHAALAAALDLVQKEDPMKGSVKTAADTIFFLSDGRPSTGEITEPQILVEWVRDLNQRAKIVIHTIAFGQENRVLMEIIARDSGGQSISIGR